MPLVMDAPGPSTTSTVSASGVEAITTELDVNPLVQTSELSLEEVYDVVGTCREIRERGWTRVCLQFPDELLHDSVSVFKAIRKRLPDHVEMYVMADTTYGSCCVDEVAAQHVDAQAIIHYGHACLTASSRLPVLYVFPKMSIDTRHAQESIRTYLRSSDVRSILGDRSILVLRSDVAYYWQLEELYQQLKQSLSQQYTLYKTDIDTSAYLHPDASAVPKVIATPEQQTAPVTDSVRQTTRSRSRSKSHSGKSLPIVAAPAPVALAQGFCCALHASSADGPSVCGCRPGDAIAGCSANSGEAVSLKTRRRTALATSAKTKTSTKQALSRPAPVALAQGFCCAPHASDRDGPTVCGCQPGDAIAGCSANSGKSVSLKKRTHSTGARKPVSAKEPVSAPVALAQGFCCMPHSTDGQAVCGCQASDKIPGCTAHNATNPDTPPRQAPPAPLMESATPRKDTSIHIVNDSAPEGAQMPSNKNLQENGVIIYIGGESLTLSNLLLTNSTTPVISYDPKSKICKVESERTNKMLMRRYGTIQRAKDADVFGIVVGTLGAAAYLPTLAYLRKLLRQHRKKSYTMAVGKLTPSKLANFLEVECWVLVACGENSLVQGHKDFYKPIITPYELEVALGARGWLGSASDETSTAGIDDGYTLDFASVLKQAQSRQQTIEDDADPHRAEKDREAGDDADAPVYSTVSGTYRYRRNYGDNKEIADAHDLASQVSALAIRNNDSALATVLNAAGGQHLATRIYKGLEPRYGQDEPAVLEVGRSGIASRYSGDLEAATTKSVSDGLDE